MRRKSEVYLTCSQHTSGNTQQGVTQGVIQRWAYRHLNKRTTQLQRRDRKKEKNQVPSCGKSWKANMGN